MHFFLKKGISLRDAGVLSSESVICQWMWVPSMFSFGFFTISKADRISSLGVRLQNQWWLLLGVQFPLDETFLVNVFRIIVKSCFTTTNIIYIVQWGSGMSPFTFPKFMWPMLLTNIVLNRYNWVATTVTCWLRSQQFFEFNFQHELAFSNFLYGSHVDS